MNKHRLLQLAGLINEETGVRYGIDDHILDQIEAKFEELLTLVESLRNEETRKQTVSDICRLLQK